MQQKKIQNSTKKANNELSHKIATYRNDDNGNLELKKKSGNYEKVLNRKNYTIAFQSISKNIIAAYTDQGNENDH